MKGWVMLEQTGFRENDDLRRWLNLAKRFAVALPAK